VTRLLAKTARAMTKSQLHLQKLSAGSTADTSAHAAALLYWYERMD
jgi:hypothetical protein